MQYTNNSILVVDDNEMNRNLLSRKLEMEGYVVATANDGRQALEMMAIEIYNLVLLDIVMPGMNGHEVLEEMALDAKLSRIPVIVVSSAGDTDSVIRCIKLGARDFFVKPFDMTTLKTRVWRCLVTNEVAVNKGRLAHENLTGIKTLVVDDDELCRDLMSARVRKIGYEVEAAENGADALERIRENKYDLVLLDIMMPKLDGYGVLTEMKNDPALQLVPVIMVSALDDDKNVKRCLDAGADDYVTKPFNAIILKMRIHSCVQAGIVRIEEAAKKHRLDGLKAHGESFKKTTS